jgi:elongation factor 1-beta|eukprot:COSAG01_NODE_798_length_13503_cov_8.878395_19_plen_277_part_00
MGARIASAVCDAFPPVPCSCPPLARAAAWSWVMGARLLRARGGWLPACRFFAPALLSAGASSFSLSTAMPEALPGACEYLHWETQPKGKAAADIAPAAPKAPTAAQQAAAAQQARLAKLANAAPAPAPAPPAKADDDEMDLWGDEPLGDDLTAEEQANEERLAAIAAAHKAKKAAAGKLKKVINKSKIVLDVKPWDDETDLKAMEAACRTIVHPTNPEAIEWQASGLEDIGYGIKKLRIMCQVIDDDVSVDDDIVEVIQGFDDYVQSCDIFAFNKV